MNTRKEICEELQSVLIKHLEFDDAQIILNFHKPYLASEAWIISKNKIITEAYTATGSAAVDLNETIKAPNLDWEEMIK